MISLVVFAAGVVCALGANLPSGLIPMPDGRIVGGSKAAIEDYPWQISMNYLGSHRCGGSIVHPKVVVSAAHCVVGAFFPSLLMSVKAGTNRLGSGAVSSSVEKVIYHDKYNSRTVDYDFSILILKSAFDFNEKVNAVALPTDQDRVLDGQIASISGFGTTRENGLASSDLLVVNVPVTNQEECIAAYQKINVITDRMICAGVQEGGQDACQGDSGGPMVVNKKLVGVVSWGEGCARKGYPGVYSRVSAANSWISEKLSENNIYINQ